MTTLASDAGDKLSVMSNPKQVHDVHLADGVITSTITTITRSEWWGAARQINAMEGNHCWPGSMVEWLSPWFPHLPLSLEHSAHY